MEQEIRTSQTIHTYGPGAIADFPELSVLILSHDIPQKGVLGGDEHYTNAVYWGEDFESPVNRIDDDRLAIAFSVECFVTAPTTDSINKAKIQSIRFPSILQCPVTGQLFDARELEQNEDNYLDRRNRAGKNVDETFTGFDSPNFSKRKLIPVRFIIATEGGHLDDFPFDWYIHTRLKLYNEIGKGNKLYLKNSGSSATLKNIKLESRHRDTNALLGSVTLEKIFDQEDTFVDLKEPFGDYMQYVKNKLPKPWYGRNSKATSSSGKHIKDFRRFQINNLIYPPYSIEDSDEVKKMQLAKYPRTLLRGAGNLYFPIVYKGISLPKNGYSPSLPEDFVLRLKKAIASWEDFIDNKQDVDEYIPLLKKTFDKRFKDLPYDISEVLNYAEKYFEKSKEEKVQLTAQELRKQEFDCFLNENVISKKNEWYDSRIVDGSSYKLGLPNLIEKVVLLDKIKELKIFRGFTRIKPLMFEDLIFDNPENVTGRRRAELDRIQDPRSESTTNTLPCTEVRGEGIFIKFNNSILHNWENKQEVKERFRIIERNNNDYRASYGLEPDEVLTARYILLHTLSHILINELSIECGYGSSSLSEIIYSGNLKEPNMNGILIYTSTSDSEGTLGGLVEKGEPTFLSNVFEKALGKASWCSSDPLCLDNTSGKGFMGLNLGACHSCCLLPETSCCNMNKFLDRGMLIGTLDNPMIGLFSQ